jgi:hypothetical protein
MPCDVLAVLGQNAQPYCQTHLALQVGMKDLSGLFMHATPKFST